jgi:hypothetical protein
MWIEIFKTGTYRDEINIPRFFTEDDLDTIVKNFNPRDHMVPVIIGSVKNVDLVRDKPPVWAYVDNLKREGTILSASLRDMIPEFEEMIKQGAFKKRSISFFPKTNLFNKWSLLALGFVGADPPSLPSLDSFEFSEQSVPCRRTIDFEDAQFFSGTAGESLILLVNRKMRAKPELNYKDAYIEVEEENPGISKEYVQEIRMRYNLR